jgi:alternate signal-mediated exported protein
MGKTNQPRRGSWSRRNKGLVAGAIGLALLVGGGSTFAIWSDTTNKTVTPVSTGVLDLTDTATLSAYDISGDTSLKNKTTKLGYLGQSITLDSFNAVPMDSIEIDLTTTVTLVGSNIKANLTVTGDSSTTDVPTGWTIKYWILKDKTIVVGTNLTTGEKANTLLTSTNTLSYEITGPTPITGDEYTVAIRAEYNNDSQQSGHPANATDGLDIGKLTITLTQGDREGAAPSPSS